jgi:sugar/nucleoside kinase (ribokinase family)
LPSAGREPALWPRFAADRRFDVLGIGQCSLDRVAFVDGPPPLPEAPDPPEALELPGGMVATAVLACARLGLRTAYAGAVGDDAAAAAVIEPLRRAGVDVSGVHAIPGARTRGAVIYVERKSGERHVRARRDPRLVLPPEAADAAAVASAGVLHLDAEHPEAALRAARRARAAGVAVMLDLDAPGPGVEELLAAADFPIVSRRFAEWISGSGSAAEGLAQLLARGARLAVATLGAEGAISRARGDPAPVRSAGFRVEARDTTGAGDVFHAAFAFGLLRGLGRTAALRTANAAAAMSCRAIGAQGGLPDRAALESFLAAHADRDGAGRGE